MRLGQDSSCLYGKHREREETCVVPPVILGCFPEFSDLGVKYLLHFLSIQENSASKSWSRIAHPCETLIRVPQPSLVWAQLQTWTISVSRTQQYTRTEIADYFSGNALSRLSSLSRTRSGGCLFQWHWPCSSTWQVSGSVLSVYSGDFGSVDAQGTVEFALDYDEKNREFQVHVSQCKDLAVVDEKKGRSDPWVTLWCLVTSTLLNFVLWRTFLFCFLCLNIMVFPSFRLLAYAYCWDFTSWWFWSHRHQ